MKDLRYKNMLERMGNDPSTYERVIKETTEYVLSLENTNESIDYNYLSDRIFQEFDICFLPAELMIYLDEESVEEYYNQIMNNYGRRSEDS
jgi:hypothetical protein